MKKAIVVDHRQELVKQCETDLAVKRGHLVQSLATFRKRVDEVSDWRTHLQNNLGRTMLVSLVLGYWLGSASSRKNSHD
ncbi:MAG: hypothetical protein SGI86_19235 [Deltaproteobacteria bacterium]|nr:hypothetical protein [Deltaproteobacteria bacterium]